MASLDEAFTFPLTDTVVNDIEKSSLNEYARGSYIKNAKNTYKDREKSVSDLKMYNYHLKSKNI